MRIFEAGWVFVAAAIVGCNSNSEPLPAPNPNVTFKLRNDSGAPIFVRQASSSPYNHWTAITAADGAIVERVQPWCNSACDGPSPRCAENQPPTIVELGPGAELTEDWDGTHWVADATSGCYTPTRARTGRFEVSFCYGYGRNGVALEHAACVAQTFDFAAGVVVTEVITEPKPQDVRFVLRNSSSRPAWVTNNLACSVAPGWLALTDAAGAPLSIEEGTCGCQCGRPCAPCAAACVAPQVVLLAPGQSVEHVWDGFYNQIRADASCLERRIAPNEALTASFCHGDDEPVGFEPIASPVCQRVTFHPRHDPEVIAEIRD